MEYASGKRTLISETSNPPISGALAKERTPTDASEQKYDSAMSSAAASVATVLGKKKPAPECHGDSGGIREETVDPKSEGRIKAACDSLDALAKPKTSEPSAAERTVAGVSSDKRRDAEGWQRTRERLEWHLQQIWQTKEETRVAAVGLLTSLLAKVVRQPLEFSINLLRFRKSFEGCLPALSFMLCAGFKVSADGSSLLFDADCRELLLEAQSALRKADIFQRMCKILKWQLQQIWRTKAETRAVVVKWLTEILEISVWQQWHEAKGEYIDALKLRKRFEECPVAYSFLLCAGFKESSDGSRLRANENLREWTLHAQSVLWKAVKSDGVFLTEAVAEKMTAERVSFVGIPKIRLQQVPHKVIIPRFVRSDEIVFSVCFQAMSYIRAHVCVVCRDYCSLADVIDAIRHYLNFSECADLMILWCLPISP